MADSATRDKQPRRTQPQVGMDDQPGQRNHRRHGQLPRTGILQQHLAERCRARLRRAQRDNMAQDTLQLKLPGKRVCSWVKRQRT